MADDEKNEYPGLLTRLMHFSIDNIFSLTVGLGIGTFGTGAVWITSNYFSDQPSVFDQIETNTKSGKINYLGKEYIVRFNREADGTEVPFFCRNGEFNCLSEDNFNAYLDGLRQKQYNDLMNSEQ